MPRVACLMMQKNEDILLEPWLLYHGHLFGYENLYVYDNGSTSQPALDTVALFSGLGVNFETRLDQTADFERKNQIFVERINAMKAAGAYDVFLPMDCDEFIVHFDDSGLTCDAGAIGAYLDRLKDEIRTLRIGTLLHNIPGHLNRFYAEDMDKVFFAAGGVRMLSHGFHEGRTTLSDASRRVNLSYLHFHNKPFGELLRSARDKLRQRVDTGSPEALRRYSGHGDHLTRYFSLDEATYVGSFAGRDYVEFDGLWETLKGLGAAGAMEAVSRTEAPPAALGRRLPATFDIAAYLERYPDVKRAGVPALMHYYRHGVRENRRISEAPPPGPATPTPG